MFQGLFEKLLFVFLFHFGGQFLYWYWYIGQDLFVFLINKKGFCDLKLFFFNTIFGADFFSMIFLNLGIIYYLFFFLKEKKQKICRPPVV